MSNNDTGCPVCGARASEGCRLMRTGYVHRERLDSVAPPTRTKVKPVEPPRETITIKVIEPCAKSTAVFQEFDQRNRREIARLFGAA